MSHRRLRHLPFSLGSGTTGAKLVLYAPAMRGYADGDPVGTWSDLSREGNNATASGVARPTFKTAIQGGMPVARFDGTANYVTGNIVNTSDYATVVSTMTYSNFSTFCGGLALMKISDASDFESLTSCLSLSFNPNQQSLNNYRRSESRRSYIYPLPGTNTPFIFAHTFDGSLSTPYKNGTIGSAGGSSGAFGWDYYVLGARVPGGSTVGQFLPSDFASMIIYAAFISAALRQRIQQSSGFTFRIATK